MKRDCLREGEQGNKGRDCPYGEIPHHGSERHKEHVLGHEIKCESWDKDGSSHCKHIQGLLTRLDFTCSPTMNSKNQVYPEDARKCDVQERPEVLSINVPTCIGVSVCCALGHSATYHVLKCLPTFQNG